MLNTRRFILLFTFIFLSSTANLFAQVSAFVYQGKLQDGGAAANGTYQFEFKLFDAASGGSQIGQTLSNVPATVTNGIFTVNLDFGVASYSGAARFLDISVRLSGSGQPYTNLNPRQEVTSTPYAVRALNADQANNSANLGGIEANQYVLTTDPRLNQLPSPGNFIQNSQAQQPTANFNISGEGKANIFSAATQYNIGTTRVLAAGNGSLYAGFGAGQNNPTGGLNTFVGNNAGMATTTGTRNTFVGSGAGIQNISGSDNTFVGSGAGLANTAANNSFFGANAGKSNAGGTNNSFFGFEAGFSNVGGTENSFFGAGAGRANLGGDKNAFFGRSAGAANTEGSFNSFFGNVAGQNNTTGVGNSFFGDTSGFLNSTGGNNSFFGKGAGLVSTTGGNNTFIGYSAGINNSTGGNNTLLGANAQVATGNLQFATAIGAGATVTESNQIVLGRSDGSDRVDIQGDAVVWKRLFVVGKVQIGDLSGGGTTNLCYAGSGNNLAICSSSIRYKENVENYTRGLDLITRLRPVTFDWKQTGERDLGFIAEEVSAVEPLLGVRMKGQIEGVKYAQVTTALVNAVREQQAQIRRQQEQIDALKALVCAQNPAAAVCQDAVPQ